MRIYTIETIFCDTERDVEKLDSYLIRCLSMIRSLSLLHVPTDSKAYAVLYVSNDKKAYIDRIRGFSDSLNWRGVNFAIHEYTHPADGYKESESANHLDRMRNPNKSFSGRRNKLFTQALDARIDESDQVVRLGLDDDDVFLPTHLEEIDSIVNSISTLSSGTFACGLTQTMLGYTEEHTFRVEFVDFTRSVTGNKFFFIPPEDRDQLINSSPWRLPELVDKRVVERFRQSGTPLHVIRNNAAGMVYMRRGDNLSRQSKAPYVAELHKTVTYSSEDAFLKDLDRIEGRIGNRSFVIKPVPTALAVSIVRNDEDTIIVSTNYKEVFSEGHSVAFYLLLDGNRIANLDFQDGESAEFLDAPMNVQVRAFVRNEAKKIVARRSSNIL